MYLQHFGLTHAPLGNKGKQLIDDAGLTALSERFQWLLDSPGVGLLTAEAGIGKTATLRRLTKALNPHRYQVIYLPETDFGRVDLYRSLALALGLEPAYRRAQLWRDIKERITILVDTHQQLPVWIIDEAQNLPTDFFRDLPAFLNFTFDSRELITIWLVGLPPLAQTLDRAPYAALRSRLQVRHRLEGFSERDSFTALVTHGLKDAGCQQTLLSDSSLEILRQASKGNPRHTGILLKHSMRLATLKQLNHLPEELIEQAIKELRA